jgi:hypothetical protein
MSWKKITLFKFQQVEEINSRPGSDIDKLLFTTCAVFNLTEYELDNSPLKKAAKLIDHVKKIFESDFKPVPVDKLGKYKINYNPSDLTFGQYIELSFFLQSNPVQKAHYIFSSIVSSNAEQHRARAEYILTRPITEIIGSLSKFIANFKEFNGEYKSLFGLDEEVTGENTNSNEFNRRYGWIYSASQVAEYERITLDEAFALPIRRAFNDLGFLKAKAKYDSEQLKNNS